MRKMRLRWAALTIIVALNTLACQEKATTGFHALSEETSSIVGGTEVMVEDPLYRTVFLLRKLYNRREITEDGVTKVLYSSSRCTTSALTRQIIITAAHCVAMDAEMHRLELKDKDGNAVHYLADKIVIHPDSAEKGTDLALLHLEQPLPEDTVLVSLPEQPLSSDVKKITSSGYGNISGIPGAAKLDFILRKVELEILNYVAEESKFTVSQMNGQGVCTGDSGGPGLIEVEGQVEGKLERKVTLAGIASEVQSLVSDPTGDICNFRASYINIHAFNEWIKATMLSLAPPEKTSPESIPDVPPEIAAEPSVERSAEEKKDLP